MLYVIPQDSEAIGTLHRGISWDVVQKMESKVVQVSSSPDQAPSCKSEHARRNSTLDLAWLWPCLDGGALPGNC